MSTHFRKKHTSFRIFLAGILTAAEVVGLCSGACTGVLAQTEDLGDPLALPYSASYDISTEASAAIANEASGGQITDNASSEDAVLVGAGTSSALLSEPSKAYIASTKEKEFSPTVTNLYTSSSPIGSYSAATPRMVSFFDYNGLLNVAYQDGSNIIVERYDTSFNKKSKITLAMRMSLFGTITCDASGYYYVVTGQKDEDVIIGNSSSGGSTTVTLSYPSGKSNPDTMNVAKYNYSGAYQSECSLKGFSTVPYYSFSEDNWGTYIPFRSGNCSVAINSSGVLAVNYARQMYNGHQSNNVFYVRTSDMSRINGDGITVPYTSHAFDERIIATSDGGFLSVNLGDALPRAFEIAKLSSKLDGMEMDLFHFRQGEDRSYGYNETFAELGGIVETANSYVFLGSSERELSAACAPYTGSYYNHLEPRDLFIQILYKDFTDRICSSIPNTGAVDRSLAYRVKGETRACTGTKPSTALTPLYTKGTEVDYGVIWLTNYEDPYYAANPKILTTSKGDVVILWEKLKITDSTFAESYYAILSEDGEVLQDATLIYGTRLVSYSELAIKDDKIYWATSDYYLSAAKTYAFLHVLDVYADPVKNVNGKNGWYKENGLWVYYEANEKVTGWVKDDKKTYYCDPSTGGMVTGWKQIDNKWYYFSPTTTKKFSTGEMVYDWKEINKKWYYFTASGGMATGWKKIDSKWYYFDTNGGMITGWKKVSGKWYYFCETTTSKFGKGEMVTGWKQLDKKWYYFNSNGQMATGWKQISGKWYYLSAAGTSKVSMGEMVTGWQKIKKVWYYFREDGTMKTGWVSEGTTWYYMLADGSMATGWQDIKGAKYYFSPKVTSKYALGQMVSDWVKIDSKWYYFDTNGMMVSGGKITIGDMVYGFDDSGVWDGTSEPKPADTPEPTPEETATPEAEATPTPEA